MSEQNTNVILFDEEKDSVSSSSPGGMSAKVVPFDEESEETGHGASGSWEPEGTAHKVWRVANTPLYTPNENEQAAYDKARKYSTSVSTEEESKTPTWTGVKKGAAGAYADTADTLRSFTSPLSTALIAAGPVSEAGGAVGKAASVLGRIAGIGFGAKGAQDVAEGGEDILKHGATPENINQTLGGAGQAVLGTIGALHDTPLGNANGESIKRVARNTANAAKPIIERATTPKALATEAGALIPGAHAVGSVLGRYGSEILLGKERANEPLIKFGPSKTVKQSAGLGKIPLSAPESATKSVPSAEPEPLINEGESWREPMGFDSQPIPERRPEAPAKRVEDRLPRVPTELGSPGGPTSILEKARAVKPAAPGLRGEEALPIPQRPTSESPTLDPTRERALRHVLGDYSLDALGQTKEGVSAAQQLSNGTYQNYADLANYEGVLKPKSLAEKTGKEWTTDDFKRSKAQHGKELNPNKELVLRHLVDNYEPADIARRTEGWGRSVVTPEARP